MTEQITRINGNGQPYTTGLPKLIIMSYHNPIAINHIFENTGLRFIENGWGNFEAQPTESAQIAALFMTYDFKTRYYNNWQHKNTILLKGDHHVGFDVDSICYDCCEKNRIPITAQLKPGDRLSC